MGIIGRDVLRKFVIVIGRINAPSMTVPKENTTVPGLEATTANDSGGLVAEEKVPDEDAVCGQRYSFSLKKALSTSLDDSNTRKKPSQSSTPVKGSDAPKVTKSSSQAL
jgi:hypothetical protein